MNKSVILAAALASAFVSVVSADTFYWKNDTQRDTPQWRSFGDWQSWAVGTTADAGNPNHRVPQATDDFHAGVDHGWMTTQWMDLDGCSYSVCNLVDCYNDYAYRFLHVKNGRLTFTGSFTNSAYRIDAQDTGRFTLASTCASRFGRGGQAAKIDIKDGGILDMGGTVALVILYTTVQEGGTLNFEPMAFGSDTDYPQGTPSWLVNRGTLNAPNGFNFGGIGSSTDTKFDFYQEAGAFNLGGDFKDSSMRTSISFYLCGGTMNVTEDAAFVSASANTAVRCRPQMTNDCSATVNVAADKTFDISLMTFGERTTLTKTGAGTVRVGESLPTALVVSEGVVEPASGAKLGSALSFAEGTTLRFAAPGVQADAIDGVDNLTVEVADSLGDGSYLLFSSPDTALVAAIFDKLQAAGLTGFVNNGDSITHEKSHDSTIFAWKNEGRADTSNWRGGTYTWYPFLDPTSWQIGFDRVANTDGLVPGENDDFFISDSYQPIFAMDMGGTHRKVRNLALHMDADPSKPGQYPSQAGFRQFNVRNGTLEFTGSFTNVRAQVVAKDTGRFVLARTSAARLGWNGAQNNLIVENGGEIDIYGLVDIHILRAEIDAGGKMVFEPAGPVTVNVPGGAYYSSFLNDGTLEFPGGLEFLTSASSTVCPFRIEQREGTLLLGGPVVRDVAFKARVDFTILSGTVRVTNDVWFTNLSSLMVTNDASVAFDVAAGKTLDVSTMTFDEGASVTKTGAGTIRFGTSLPSALAVQGGTVEYAQPVALGESLTLGAGTTLAFASDGISATAIAGIDAASVTADASLLTKSCVLFSSASADLTAAVFAKLEASGAEGISLNGNVILHEIVHDPSVFTLQSTATQSGGDLSSFTDATVYQRFFDPATWSVGRATVGQNPQGLVPGEEDDLYINSQAPSENYRPLFAFDMDGAERLVSDYDKVDAAEKWGFNGFQIRNGTFGFNGTFQSTRSVVIAQPGGRFVFGDDAVVTLGYQGAQCYGIAKAGGEIVLGGDISYNAYQARIDAGGTMTIATKDGKLKYVRTGMAPESYIWNYGTLNIPDGLTIVGGSLASDKTSLVQEDGSTLNLGGQLACTSTGGTYEFQLGSATLNVTNRTAITGFTSCSMAEGATVTVNVPKGSSLNLSEMTFGADTTIEKYGSGRLIFGANRPTNYIRHDPIPGMLLLVR